MNSHAFGKSGALVGQAASVKADESTSPVVWMFLQALPRGVASPAFAVPHQPTAPAPKPGSGDRHTVLVEVLAEVWKFIEKVKGIGQRATRG
jgi:hypothetical protein